MADPMPVDNVDDEYARASEAIRKLRRAKPVSKSEARFNSVELCRLQQTLVEAARAVAVRRSTNGSGSPGAPGASISGDMKALVRVIAGEIAALQRRIAALEARPSVKYEGVWSAEKSYDAGSFVTFGGGLWFATDGNAGVRPGAGSTAWKLAVKKGEFDR